jgi:ParB-like chromosome segregation protein Spo0J
MVSNKPTPPKVAAVDPKTLTLHEKYEAYVPSQPDAHERLKAAIERDGYVRDPILATSKGVILAGRDRWRASIELGLKTVPVIHRADLDNDADGQVRVLLLDNLNRKHYSPWHLAVVATWLARIESAKAKKRKGKKHGPEFGPKDAGKTSRIVSKLLADYGFKVGKNKVEDMAAIVEDAEKGKADLHVLFMRGLMSASLCVEAIKSLMPDDQKKIVAQVEKAPTDKQAKLSYGLVRDALDKQKPPAPKPKPPVNPLGSELSPTKKTEPQPPAVGPAPAAIVAAKAGLGPTPQKGQVLSPVTRLKDVFTPAEQEIGNPVHRNETLAFLKGHVKKGETAWVLAWFGWLSNMALGIEALREGFFAAPPNTKTAHLDAEALVKAPFREMVGLLAGSIPPVGAQASGAVRSAIDKLQIELMAAPPSAGQKEKEIEQKLVVLHEAERVAERALRAHADAQANEEIANQFPKCA